MQAFVPYETNTRARALRVLIGVVMLALCVARPAAAQGVHVAILPTGQTVAPGSSFTLALQVTESGSSFNGFDAVVEFDPAALTFVPTSPTSLQQGAYMTGACGSTFHRFSAAADSMAITDVLLCNDLSLPGPGQIYTLTFTASNVPQVTHVRFRSVQFYNSGLYVNPAYTEDAAIGIGLTVGAGPLAPPAGFAMRVAPNPFRGGTVIRVIRPFAGTQRVVVRDIQGRRVRSLEQGWFPAGEHPVRWDGRDDAGRPLPAGVYQIALESGGMTVRALAALLR